MRYCMVVVRVHASCSSLVGHAIKARLHKLWEKWFALGTFCFSESNNAQETENRAGMDRKVILLRRAVANLPECLYVDISS